MISASMSYRTRRPGFTLTEVLVVIGLLVVIMSILLPALSSVRTQALMTNSMSNLRQVAAFMQLYSSDNRETIVPSQFDYSEAGYPGKVRSEIPSGPAEQVGEENQGTWADILWTVNELGPIPLDESIIGFHYHYTVPDRAVYDFDSSFEANPFRAAEVNSRDFTDAGGALGTGPKPYGTGAAQRGYPGFFAANNFFDSRPEEDPDGNGLWYATGQIRHPSRSMYLVDSYAGYIIEPEVEPYDNMVDSNGHRTIEVDFRYSGNALMLFLDGHIDPVGPWDDLDQLEEGDIRVRSLDQRTHQN